MLVKLETLQLDPQEEVEVFTAGPSGAFVAIIAHDAAAIWIVKPAPEGTSLFDRGFLLPDSERKLRFHLGNGQSVSVVCDPSYHATATVSVLVEVLDA